MLHILAINVLFNVTQTYLSNKISYKLPFIHTKCDPCVLKSSPFPHPTVSVVIALSIWSVFSYHLYRKATIFCAAQQKCSQSINFAFLASVNYGCFLLSTSLFKPIMAYVQEPHCYSLLAMLKCTKLAHQHSPSAQHWCPPV